MGRWEFRSRRAALVVVALLVGGVHADAAHATPVTVSISAQVAGINDAAGWLQYTGLQPGDTIHATYTFDPNSTDLDPADPDHGRYGISSFVVPLPSGTIVFGNGAIDVTNDYNGTDTYAATAGQVMSYNGIPAVDVTTGVLLIDSDGTALSSDALPVPPPALGPFEIVGFSLEFKDATGLQISAVLTAPLTTVPEPGRTSLMGLGLLALGWLEVRRRTAGRRSGGLPDGALRG